MQIPLQISLHGIEQSNALYNSIREKAEKLDRYYEHIMSCRVVLELAGRHKHRGKQFVVRVDLKVPGSEIVVTHEHDEDLEVALRECGSHVYESEVPSPGTPTQPLEKGWLVNTWFRLRHPDYDRLRAMMTSLGRTVKAVAR